MLKFYDTLTGKKQEFVPIEKGFVGMYVCGPTVYSSAHLGNCRTFVSFDVIYRTLLYLGNKVRYVRNITDVGHLLDDGEDRMSKGARLQKLEPMEVAQKHTVGFHEMLSKFNCLPPSIEPRATGHIIEQIEMVQEILNAGLAYESNGSVYFNVQAYLDKGIQYGKLSGRKIDDLLAESRALKAQSDKRHPSDFAIWMKAGEDHIMKWNSPWSVGFPGWHLECSAMSRKYLGQKFDIHGGGNDLKFPHHENEIAQNRAACGEAGANYWLHTNMLLLNGKKMSKSDGNHITPEELFTGNSEHVSKGYSAMVVRFFMLQAHYGSPLDMSDDALQGAEKGFSRLMDMLKRMETISANDNGNGSVNEELTTAINDCHNHLTDDFNTPRALASLFECASIINSLVDGHKSVSDLNSSVWSKTKEQIQTIVHDVLGLQASTRGNNTEQNQRLDGLMNLVIEVRGQSRADKNWTIADTIRDRLKELNIELKDGKDGTDYKFN